MLSPTQLGEAGDEVAAVYSQIEVEMLDHLINTMLTGSITNKTATELAFLVQTHEADLRKIIEDNRDAIDASVIEMAERYLEASDADDRDRLLQEDRKAPAQIVATAKGISEILARDNLQMVQGAKDAFLRASVEAVTAVNAGYLTTDKAVHKAVRKLAREGINIITYQNATTGKVTVSNKVDVAVRRHVRTQISQDANRMSMERLDKLEIKLVEVSSHADARPSHAEWQGQCYSLNGEITIGDVTYPDFYLHCMSGDLGDILGGVNCKHSFGPYRHGAPRKYEPNPKHPSGLPGEEVYKLEQKQRYIERQIRADKRELRAAQLEYKSDPSLPNKTNLLKAQERLKRRQEGMREFIKETNARSKNPRVNVLTRKPNREWAGDMPKSKMVTASHRSVNQFLNQQGIKSQMKSAGISNTRMRAEISAEMMKRGGSLSDFASLSAKEQQSIFSKIKGAIDSKLPGTKRANAGHHTDKLAGITRGEPMPFDKANGGRVNPKFKSGKGYKSNCQTCVVAFEARLRGYDVTAKAREYSEHAPTQILARNTNKAWIDPSTNKHPSYIQDATATTPAKAKAFLNSTVKQGERYTLEFTWKGNRSEGHIITVDRNDEGVLRLYDPQNGKTFLDVDEVVRVYTREEIERRKKILGSRSKRASRTQDVKNPILDYLMELKYTSKIGGIKFYDGPQLLRIDNVDFNRDIVDKVLEGS